MKNFALTILLSGVIASPLTARIGETPQECVKRYGEPVKVDKETQGLFFEKAGFQVQCSFRDGKCAMISFWHAERDALGNPTALSQAEIEQLLEVNSGGAKWKKGTGISVNRQFVTEDGSFSAVYFTFKNFLAIITKDEAEKREKEGDAADRAKLKDF